MSGTPRLAGLRRGCRLRERRRSLSPNDPGPHNGRPLQSLQERTRRSAALGEKAPAVKKNASCPRVCVHLQWVRRAGLSRFPGGRGERRMSAAALPLPSASWPTPLPSAKIGVASPIPVSTTPPGRSPFPGGKRIIGEGAARPRQRPGGPIHLADSPQCVASPATQHPHRPDRSPHKKMIAPLPSAGSCLTSGEQRVGCSPGQFCPPV